MKNITLTNILLTQSTCLTIYINCIYFVIQYCIWKFYLTMNIVYPNKCVSTGSHEMDKVKLADDRSFHVVRSFPLIEVQEVFSHQDVFAAILSKRGLKRNPALFFFFSILLKKKTNTLAWMKQEIKKKTVEQTWHLHTTFKQKPRFGFKSFF